MRKLIIGASLLAWSATGSAQYSLSLPKPGDLPQEPKRSISHVVLKAKAQDSGIAQWLLMRWYQDYQGTIKYDHSDPVIAKLLRVTIPCPGDSEEFTFREGLELRVMDAQGFFPRYTIKHRHGSNVVSVITRLTVSGLPDILQRAQLSQYKMEPTRARPIGTWIRSKDGESWQHSQAITYGPLISVISKRTAFCTFRFQWRKDATQWVNKTRSEKTK